MIDIVTVVFRDELPVLRVQAQSIDLYCGAEQLGRIYVVVNDEDAVASMIDTAWWGQHQSRVHVVPRSMFSDCYVSDGWVSQQVLKMLGSSMSDSDWSMVMDAKTVLVRPVSDDLWDEQQRIKAGSFPIYEVFYPSRDITNQLFGIQLESQLGPGGVPFFFRPQLIRGMISWIESRVNESFVTWFQSQGRLTEFILYSGYVHMTQDPSYNLDQNSIKPVNICHSETGIYDIKLDQMRQQNPLTVSVHRRAWSNISQLQQQAFRDFLISRNLSFGGDL